MATAAELAAFEADQRHITVSTASQAAAIALRAYDLAPRDMHYFSELLSDSSHLAWLNHMMRDQKGRLLWIHGGDQMRLTYLASEWDGDATHLAALHDTAQADTCHS